MREVRTTVPDLSMLRMQRGISLRQISDDTKIRVFYLEAIEKGEFAKLPGGTYSRSYIRQYAAAIDFDAEELLRGLPSASDSGVRPAETAERPFTRLLRLVSPVLIGLSRRMHGTG